MCENGSLYVDDVRAAIREHEKPPGMCKDSELAPYVELTPGHVHRIIGCWGDTNLKKSDGRMLSKL